MSNFMKTKGGFVVNRPGRVAFVPIKSDGTEDLVNTIVSKNKIVTITCTNSRATADIPDGNSDYPAGTRTTGITGTVAIEFSTIDPEIWAMAAGTTLETKEDGTLLRIYDYDKINDEAKIILEDEYKENEYIKVIGSDGTEYEKVTSVTEGSPTTGEFKVEVTGGKTTLTFNADAKGKNVMVAMYVKAVTTSYTQGKKSMKDHKIIIDTDFSDLGETEIIPVNIVISQASLVGDMTDNLQKDPTATKTLTFNIHAPLPGEQPYTVSYKDKKNA